MSNTYQLHLDTISPTPPSSPYPIVIKNGGNPFDSTINLFCRHNNLQRVSLSSAEIPLAFNTVRAPYNTFRIGNQTFTVTPGVYTNIQDLLNALNTAVSGTGSFSYDGSKFSFTLDN